MAHTLVSCDDHLDLPYVPADVWQERLPAKLRDAGPRVVDTAEGTFWTWEGERKGAFGRKPGLIDSFERAGLVAKPEPGVFRPGSVKYRLQDMDRDGVAAQVVYPPSWSLKFRDTGLTEACLRAFNDWFLQDFCGTSGGRLVALPLLPLHSVEAALEELRHQARAGAKGVLFDPWGGTKPPFDDCWEPLWALAEEAGILMHFHISTGLHSLRIRFGSWEMAAGTSVVHMQMDEILSGMVFSGVLERHPKLKFVLAECSIGWVPYVLEQMDFQQSEWAPLVAERRLPLKASEYFRRQMFVTFEKDAIGVRLIPDIGEDNVMWAADYPHGISTFPHSRQTVDAMFAASTPEIKRKVTCDNAARLYGIALP